MLIKTRKQLMDEKFFVAQRPLTIDGKEYKSFLIGNKHGVLARMSTVRYYKLMRISHELGIDPILGVVNLALIFGKNIQTTEYDELEAVLYGLRNQFK